MSRKANPTTLGVFVISIVALIVATLVFFGSGDVLQEKTQYQMFFTESVKGLRVGSPVLLKGVEIGSVKGVHAVNDKNGDFYVKVVIETVNGRVRNEGATLADDPEEMLTFLLAKGLRAQLESQSLLTGQLAVKLDYMPETEEHFVRLDDEFLEIPVVPSPQDQLMSGLTDAMSQLASLPIADIANELLETMEAMQAILAELKLGGALAEFQATLKEARSLIHELHGFVSQLMEEVSANTDSMGEAIDSLDRMVVRLDTMLEANDPQIQSTIDDFAASARSLRSLLDYLDRNPEALLKGKKN